MGSGFYFLLSKYILPDLPDTTDFAKETASDAGSTTAGEALDSTTVGSSSAPEAARNNGGGVSQRDVSLRNVGTSVAGVMVSPGVLSDEDQKRKLTGDIDSRDGACMVMVRRLYHNV